MDITDDQHFFAVALYQHRELGLIAGAYLVVPINGDTYKIERNLIVDSAILHSDRTSIEETEILKSVNEITEKALIKLFGRDAKTFPELMAKVHSDENLNTYIRSYIDRRLHKILEKAATINTPIFLRDRNANHLYAERKLVYHLTPAHPIYRFELDNGIRYSLKVKHNNKEFEAKPDKFEILTQEPCLIKFSNNIFYVQGVDGKKFSPYLNKNFISIPPQSVQQYMETFVLNAVRNSIVESSGFEIVEKHNRPIPILVLEERLAGGACLTLRFKYGNKIISANTPVTTEVKLSHRAGRYSFTKLTRSSDKENKFKNRIEKDLKLKRVGENEFFPGNPKNDGLDDFRVIEWLNQNQQKISAFGFETLQRYKQANYHLTGFNLSVEVHEDLDWFDLYGIVEIGTFKVPFIYFRKHIIKNYREYTLPNGQIFILPEEWFAKYRTIFILGKQKGNKLVLPKANIALLAENNLETESMSKFADMVKNLSAKSVSLPKTLNAKFRKYQTIGFVWLKSLSDNGLNGCLADDMGLGKTLQTIALVLSELEKNDFKKGENHTSIVVAPTSIIFNWLNEFNKFAPSVRVGIYHGVQREKSFRIFKTNHVVITSYGTIRNDIGLLKDFPFKFIVLDESQTIKNPASKTYRSVLLLKSQKKLCLSGTPIENNLFDLWSQMNFLNRGMLGGIKVFRDEFVTPIEKKDDKDKQKLLKKLVEPIILRRTKEQVAKELPPLTEQIIYCEMTDEQNRIYEEEKSKTRRMIIEAFESSQTESFSVNVLAALTRLRQLANHPAMIDDFANITSGKFEEITQMIESVISENHKILIFSSFVKHLSQVENYLSEKGIGYELLTGSTTNRENVVENFQNDPNKKIFLISLKAGGVGLNLTAADYIFILDPWWNPAAEMQAASRAHRIGQTKKVFVYRFITRNTVEEKIIKLQSHKESLAHEFVNSNNPMVLLNKEQLISLVE